MPKSLLSLRTFAVLLATLGAVWPAGAAEPSLLQWIPGSCNAVAVVHMRKLVESPIGKKEKWGDKVRQAYTEGLLSAPPWVREVVRGTTFGAFSSATPTTYSVYSMDQKSVIADIARHERSSTEKIAGSYAVLSPRGIYFVQLAPGIVGAVQPPDRRAVSAWVRWLASGRGIEVSPYLKEAVEEPDQALIVLAVDLTDTLNRRRVRDWLGGSPSLNSLPNLDGLASLLAGIHGGRLSLAVDDTISGRLRLDFDAPIGPQSAALKAAILQWLDDAGAQMEVLVGAQATASDKSLTFDASLNERALRRILSLIQSPHVPGKDEAAGADSQTPNAVATAGYYDLVCQLLNALIRQNRSATNYDKTALWHETYARKIAGLSTTGVDPELAAWGRDVSNKLLALASSLRGVPVEVNQLQKSIRFDTSTYYRWYANSAESGPMYFPAWVKSQDNVAGVRAQESDVIAKNSDQREAIWNMLKDATAEIARKMEYKYKIKLKLPQ